MASWAGLAARGHRKAVRASRHVQRADLPDVPEGDAVPGIRKRRAGKMQHREQRDALPEVPPEEVGSGQASEPTSCATRGTRSDGKSRSGRVGRGARGDSPRPRSCRACARSSTRGARRTARWRPSPCGEPRSSLRSADRAPAWDQAVEVVVDRRGDIPCSPGASSAGSEPQRIEPAADHHRLLSTRVEGLHVGAEPARLRPPRHRRKRRGSGLAHAGCTEISRPAGVGLLEDQINAAGGHRRTAARARRAASGRDPGRR